jgi:hypothetical protein
MTIRRHADRLSKANIRFKTLNGEVCYVTRTIGAVTLEGYVILSPIRIMAPEMREMSGLVKIEKQEWGCNKADYKMAEAPDEPVLTLPQRDDVITREDGSQYKLSSDFDSPVYRTHLSNETRYIMASIKIKEPDL